MKILKWLLLVAFVSGLVTVKGQSSIGLFAGYGSEAEEVSFGLNAEIFIIPRLSMVPSGAFYLPSKKDFDGGDVIRNFFEINGDLHGYVAKEESVAFYLLLGINYMHEKVKFSPDPIFGPPVTKKGSDTGANLGIGITFGENDKSPRFFIEVKSSTSFEGQIVFTGGFRFH